jgi:hypothetical protein
MSKKYNDLEQYVDIQTSADGKLIGIKAKSNNMRHRQAAFIIVLRRTYGNVSKASELTGISRDCHYDWIKKYEDYKAEVEKVDDLEFDFIKNQALARVQAGSDSMIQYLMRSPKYKAKGYAPDDISISNPIPVTIIEKRLGEGESLPEKPQEQSS